MYGVYPSGYGSTSSRDRRSMHEAIPRRSSSSQVPSSRGYENGTPYSADPYGRHPAPTSAQYHGISSSRTRSKSPKKQSQHKQPRSPSPRSKKRNRSRSKSGSRSKRSRSPASPPHKTSSASSQSRKSSTYAQSVHSSGGAGGSSRALPSASLGAELQKVLGEKRKLPTPVNIASEPMRKSIKSESEMVASPAKESPPDSSKKDEKYSTSKICKTMTLPPLPLPDVDDNEDMDTAGENIQKDSPL